MHIYAVCWDRLLLCSHIFLLVSVQNEAFDYRRWHCQQRDFRRIGQDCQEPFCVIFFVLDLLVCFVRCNSHVITILLTNLICLDLGFRLALFL